MTHRDPLRYLETQHRTCVREARRAAREGVDANRAWWDAMARMFEAKLAIVRAATAPPEPPPPTSTRLLRAHDFESERPPPPYVRHEQLDFGDDAPVAQSRFREDKV